MLKLRQILVNSIVLAGTAAALAGCGQKGPLYLPSDPVAAQRATLIETLTPLGTTPPPMAPPAQLLMPPPAPATPASSGTPAIPAR
jgi:predicted small lipoprotein YifL